ncbi:hypothetical protein EH31_01770 [Erythrobacter longus]|uniref:SCP domain-containing protein n=1 Tax=Erythrobacter longus TaxID=1044 RepID=A0A074MHS6_ERYLO|nr:CAP domain-containing protein [Erythrobacter longus]KEO91418.1 hypothetical protein EH31_01770 [Erythrobacter longus]
MVTRATILSAVAALACALSIGSNVSAHGDLSGEEAAWLTAHNDARQEFGTAPLQWSDKLTREAEQWARQLARENTMRHSRPEDRGRTGESLWMGTSGYFHPAQMIGFFVEEQRYFQAGRFPDVSRTGNWADVGHYTQIVWADTREVGCAKASNGRNDVLVCRYYPGGNVLGEVIAPQRKVARR